MKAEASRLSGARRAAARPWVRWASTVAGGGALALASGLTGCASPSSTPMSLEQGERGHLVDCSGFRLGAADCLEQADKTCDGDYEIIASTGQWHSTAVAGVLESVERGMIIRCREPEAE